MFSNMSKLLNKVMNKNVLFPTNLIKRKESASTVILN